MGDAGRSTGSWPRPSRRALLKGAAAASLLGMPFIRSAKAAERSLRVSTFGGCFENCLVRTLYPEFEKATGIRIEPVADGTDRESVDLVTVGQEDVARGREAGHWRPFDARRLPHLDLLDKRFVQVGSAGVDAVAGMAWYQTLVVNPGEVRTLPTSWKALWEPTEHAVWGLASGGRSTLFEITAATWFGGNDVLDTPEGIRLVLAKIEELKPNVKLWWNAEGAMRDAYEDGDIVGGMYFNDVARLMAQDGTAIASIFPKEGGVIDFGSWCQPASSTKTEEAAAFVDFMCMPATQAMMTRKIGTAPLVARRLTDLTDAEFAAASSDREPISIAIRARAQSLDLMNRQFLTMLTS